MIHGIINVLKPTGMSSHDVIGCLRRIYGMKKMGHAGTLDPLAAGVLPVYAGQATRLIEYGDSDVKSYHAEFVLGLETDTEDSTGTVVERAPVPNLSEDDLRRALASFCGDIDQAPSKYSAINVNGVKAYKLARQDRDFTLPVRQVTIHSLELLSFDGRRGTFAVTCSKGTYVRSLIRDLGTALGTCACMTYLVRTRAGLFTIEEAATLEMLEANPEAYVLPADMAIHDLRRANCSEKQCSLLLQGRPVPFAGPNLKDDDVLRVYGPDGRLMGIVRYDEQHHILRPHKMFADGL
ncbi:tRNA pseudouridine(55) synthase TruB [uncultured Megasphaera sp.]|uniref:tRNA pseudouridine(55) synthase TruB n=1 Tax=uncultured Megasphaera sp. TaxID=165188 RepID=UPI0025F2F70F|nr:tRNA pseudouridine(55) synthase TruB [uncultured Megasphaera sp.]